MIKRGLAVTAIVLWIVTMVVVAVLFVRGNTEQSMDGRIAVKLSASERTFVLNEMRTLLGGVNSIIAGLAQDDMPSVASAARRIGMRVAVDANPQLLLKLPLDLKQTGLGLHQAFDELANAVDRGESKQQIEARLATQLAVCVGCHERYQLVVARPE